MRLDFNVLWVEDQQQAVQSQRERIELLMRKEGFRLRVEFAPSVEKAKEYLSSDIYGDHIDLILMDYDLGAGASGDVGLQEVRNLFSYKDIIFYSSQADNLLELVNSKRVQGIYCSTRVDLPGTVEGAFEALVKKVLDIDHSRGIVMGATSDIDQYVNDCLVAVFNKSDVECRSATLAVVARHMKTKKKDFDKAATAIAAALHVSDLFDKHYVYTSYNRLRLLKNALKISGLYKDRIEPIEQYLSVVPKRNMLAHLRVETEGFSRKLIDEKGKELTSDDMRAFRLELLGYQELFETLVEEVKE